MGKHCSKDTYAQLSACKCRTCTLRGQWPRGHMAATMPAEPHPSHLHGALSHRTAHPRPSAEGVPAPHGTHHPHPPAADSQPAPAQLMFSRCHAWFISLDLTAGLPNRDTKLKITHACYHPECLKKMTCSLLLGISRSSSKHQKKAKIPGGNAFQTCTRHAICTIIYLMKHKQHVAFLILLPTSAKHLSPL